ncbi:MAG: hypothetical protein Q4D98_01780 [Planctomycetia bacterium]|nr:hypothetical protein [Planctomycetia bacterium]
MPETKESRYDEAVNLKAAGKTDAAIESMEKLCVDFPEYALPHAALSMWYTTAANSVKAMEHATRVCELEPEDPFSFIAMSALAVKSGDHKAAEEALGKVRMIQLKHLMEQQKQQES